MKFYINLFPVKYMVWSEEKKANISGSIKEGSVFRVTAITFFGHSDMLELSPIKKIEGLEHIGVSANTLKFAFSESDFIGGENEHN